MDFTLSDEQKMLIATTRNFAERELGPIAAKIDEEASFPWDAIVKAANVGLMGVGYPEKYGGSGGGAVEQVLMFEELARVCAATSVILIVTNELTSGSIYNNATESQKQKFLLPLLKGEKLGAFAVTESNAGSDILSIQTTAKRDGDGYILNGNKVFITNGAEADIIVIFATVDRALAEKGITAFIFEKSTEGFSVGKHERKMGIRASSTAELIFNNCYVPRENRLGNEGKGLKIALETIDGSRLGIAAQANGIALAAFERSISYAKERKQFGQRIGNFQAIQWILADMATMIDASRLLTLRAASMKDNGLRYIKEAAMAKVYAAETAVHVTNKAVQIHGGYGYMKDYPLERYYRDAKITEIYEGTSEMQRWTIAKQLLKD